MKFQRGTYTGNGTVQSIATAFEPDLIVITAFATEASFWARTNWVERTNAFMPTLSQTNAIALTATGFAVGTGGNTANSTNSKVNANAVTYYWFAIAGAHDQSLEISSTFGNNISGRRVDLQTAKTPAALILKRDTARAALLRMPGFSQGALTTFMDGSTTSSTTAYILTIGSGFFTVDGGATFGPWVNQLGSQFGEACTHMAFFSTSNFAVVEWAGDNTTNRTLVADAGFAIQAAIVLQTDGARATRIKTADMAGGLVYPVSNSATALPNDLSISGNALASGSATNCNQSTKRYIALLFGPDDGTSIPRRTKVPATAKGSGRKFVSLPGRTVLSAIDCGASDTLKIDGALSYELLARTFYTNPAEQSPPVFNWIMGRSSGAITTAGNVSYGLGLCHWSDGTTQGLSGPMLVPAVTNYQLIGSYSGAPADVGLLYRTGLLPPEGGRWQHLVVTHNGTGRWRVFVNGKLAKQRDVDMLTNAALTAFSPNIQSVSGHKLTFGARWTGSAYADALRMDLARARIYASELTMAQAGALFDRFGNGNTATADVTGFAEEWDAANASGTSLPAGVNAANNGTIVLGSIGAM